MYPDWRFRPGANALAKLKVKDGGTTTRRRSARVKDPPDETVDEESADADQGEKGRGKGKGRNKASARMLSLEEMRCAKIADFVADGIRGEELEVAVKQWEGDRKMGRERSQRQPRTRGTVKPAALDNHAPLPSDVPLTHMFKRSLSAPASPTNLPAGPIPAIQVSPTGTHSHAHERRDSFPMPSAGSSTATGFDTPPQHLTWQDAENQRRMEGMQEPNSWWGDSRSAEVEPSTFGYPERASGITEMGYENCGGTHFDGGFVEVGLSPFFYSVISL